MIDFFAKPKDARVYVVEPMVALRAAVVDALRHAGFTQITGFGDLKTMLDHLSSENADWILSASFSSNEINIMHLLSLCIEEPRLNQCRVSLMLRDHEKEILPLAFELGLLSYHDVAIPSRLADEISDLLRVVRAAGFYGTLASANFLQRYLREARRWDSIIELAKSLLDICPGSPQILLSLAEAELSSGREEGQRTLRQVLLLDPGMNDEVNRIGQKFSVQEKMDLPLDLSFFSDSEPANNALNLASCMVVDPDTDVHNAVRQALKFAGVERVETYESGLSAWNALKNGARPALILMEWRLPELSGLQLVQRISQDFPNIPIVLISSLITQAEGPLLKELGARWIVEKPFEVASLMGKIITAIQQHRYPTDKQSMERKIVNLLNSGNKVEAGRLFALYLASPDSSEIGRLRLEAEFAFADGRFQDCCMLAYKALKISDDSVELLNLLAKPLMKLGDFENAFRLLEKANALAPRNIDRICKMADIAMDLDSTERAESLLNEAKSIDRLSIIVAETEASMAIRMEDSKRAAKAMKNLENLQRIVGFTNNKAVAQVRNNKFDKGIQLYRTALESLPEPWGTLHDTVCFNMALAYIRCAKYPEAQQSLCMIKAPANSTTRQRVDALSSKLEHAILTGSVLHFAADSSQHAPGGAAEKKTFDFSRQVDSLVPSRGDICCYRIFESRDLSKEESRKLLQNMPKLTKRPPLRREILPHKSLVA